MFTDFSSIMLGRDCVMGMQSDSHIELVGGRVVGQSVFSLAVTLPDFEEIRDSVFRGVTIRKSGRRFMVGTVERVIDSDYAPIFDRVGDVTGILSQGRLARGWGFDEDDAAIIARLRGRESREAPNSRFSAHTSLWECHRAALGARTPTEKCSPLSPRRAPAIRRIADIAHQ